MFKLKQKVVHLWFGFILPLLCLCNQVSQLALHNIVILRKAKEEGTKKPFKILKTRMWSMFIVAHNKNTYVLVCPHHYFVGVCRNDCKIFVR